MKTKVSTFLKERPERFKPGGARKLGLERIEKITQEGTINEKVGRFEKVI